MKSQLLLLLMPLALVIYSFDHALLQMEDTEKNAATESRINASANTEYKVPIEAYTGSTVQMDSSNVTTANNLSATVETSN